MKPFVYMLSVLLVLVVVGVCMNALTSNEAEAQETELFRYEIGCSEHRCIKWSPYTGFSWILSCPGQGYQYTSCEWEPLENRDYE